MFYLIVKAAISGLIVAIVSEVARRFPSFGALIVSLPLVSLLAVMWLWRDTADVGRIGAHMQATFWYVLPSLPLFLIVPAMLHRGIGFWEALGAGCLLTILLYFVMAAALARFGIRL